MLSNRADVLPEPYVRAFGTLQDDVPPRSWARMRRQLRREAPAVLEAVEWVDEAALGAASTGQAHLARLADGSTVVLKLQCAPPRRATAQRQPRDRRAAAPATAARPPHDPNAARASPNAARQVRGRARSLRRRPG